MICPLGGLRHLGGELVQEHSTVRPLFGCLTEGSFQFCLGGTYQTVIQFKVVVNGQLAATSNDIELIISFGVG